MTKKGHQDRMALIERLEKKYSQKVQSHKLRKQERSLRQSLRTIRGAHLEDSDLHYEATDVVRHNGRRLAY